MRLFKSKSLKLITIISVACLLLLYQNCSNDMKSLSGVNSLKSNEAGGEQADTSLLPPTQDEAEPQQVHEEVLDVVTCGEFPLGTKWQVPSEEVIRVAQACPYGGDLAYNFKKNIELICVNGESEPTGETSVGELISITGACNPDNCEGRPEASEWSLQEGVIKTAMACEDSTATIEKVHENINVYKCTLGNPAKLRSEQGKFVGNEGTCPAPMVTAMFSAAQAAVGTSVNLIVNAANVASVSYSCSHGLNGSLAVGTTTTPVTVSEDIACDVVARTSSGAEFTASAQVAVKCNQADQVYVNGKCQQFACKQFMEITTFPVTVPSRTSEGICYYSKLFSSVANSASQGNRNTNVVSRTHGADFATNPTSNPFILGPGPASRQFTLQGPRAVKVSGKFDVLDSIKVDNYILVGQRLSTEAVGTNQFKAYGTADSTLPGTDFIRAYGKDITLQSFGPAGTATVSALLLTQDFQVMMEYILDIHALDCGGARELSELYLMFQ